MSVQALKYTERSIAIFGETKPFKSHIIALGGKFNPSLKDKRQGDDATETTAGWIFPLTKKDKIDELIAKINEGEIKGEKGEIGEKKTEKSEKKTYEKSEKKSNDIGITDTQFMALMSRIERLEQEVAMLRMSKVKIDSPATTEVAKTMEASSDMDDDDEEPVKPKRLLKTKKIKDDENDDVPKTKKKTEKKVKETDLEEDNDDKVKKVKKTDKVKKKTNKVSEDEE